MKCIVRKEIQTYILSFVKIKKFNWGIKQLINILHEKRFVSSPRTFLRLVTSGKTVTSIRREIVRILHLEHARKLWKNP